MEADGTFIDKSVFALSNDGTLLIISPLSGAVYSQFKLDFDSAQLLSMTTADRASEIQVGFTLKTGEVHHYEIALNLLQNSTDQKWRIGSHTSFNAIELLVERNTHL